MGWNPAGKSGGDAFPPELSPQQTTGPLAAAASSSSDWSTAQVWKDPAETTRALDPGDEEGGYEAQKQMDKKKWPSAMGGGIRL